MAFRTEVQSSGIYITNVEGEGPFLRITGQLDKEAAMIVETLINQSLDGFEKGIGTATAASIAEGLICCARFKDGIYYRAKVISTSNLPTGLIKVFFIDFGNKDVISLSAIRLLDNYNQMLLRIPSLISEFFLSRFMNKNGNIEEATKLKIHNILCYTTFPYIVDAQTSKYPLISIMYCEKDLSEHLASIKYGIAVTLAEQQTLLQQFVTDSTHPVSNWQRNYNREPVPFNDHVPFLSKQSFPTNPASTMRLQQTGVNYNRSYSSPVPPISQRFAATKNAIAAHIQGRTPRVMPPFPVSPSPQSSAVPIKPVSPKKAITYKSRLLEINSQHKVYVSCAEKGPELFAVQLESDSKLLESLMANINKHPLHNLSEPPMIGTVCLGRYEKQMARAIVMNLSIDNCTLYFVDFGNTKTVQYFDIFDIPDEFVKPNVFAMRFCLSSVKSLSKVPNLTNRFQQLVKNKVLTLKVVHAEGPPLIQYAELYLNNQSVYDLLLEMPNPILDIKWMDMLQLGSKRSVLVSYVDSCIEFFIQLSDMIDDLNIVMENVRQHCEQTSSPGELPIGAPCCARFPDDGNWYRAIIKEINGKNPIVQYVDYGNKQEISVSDLRTITPDLLQLPAQAMRCALKGFESKPVETKTSNQLEMLALEKTLMAHIVGMLSNNTMLVTLIDETESPALDVAKRMLQLSQPRSSTEPKQPLHRTESNFSSPDSEDGKRKYQRERSFKEERRPQDDEIGHRSGSFRGKDRESNFDRSVPGRHSEKFGSRQDRGDRRGPKPWENKNNFNRGGGEEWEDSAQPLSNQTNAQHRESHSSPNQKEVVSAADDDWDESPTQVPQNTQNRDRRKPRMNQPDRSGQKPDWKPKTEGISKRLSHTTSEPPASAPRGSVQDRLRRDNFNKRDEWEDNKSNNNWEGKNSYGSDNRRERPERREFRGEKRDNWSDRKDENRRDFRDRGGRNDDNRRDFRDRGDRNDDNRRDFRDRGDRNDENRREFRDKGDRNDENRREFRDRGDRNDENRREFRDRGDRNDENRREFRDRGDRNQRGGRAPRSSFTPRDRADRSFGSDDRKSTGSDRGDRASFRPRNNYSQVQYKELTDPVPLDTPFPETSVEPGTQHEVSVTWIISPESFYTQILSLQPKFLDMMLSIPELYKGVRPFSGIISEGASILARYPEDGVLYRATVIAVQPFGKYIVQYIDFGNKFLVEAKDIWQLDKQLLEVPKMALHCSLLGVAPTDGEWKVNNDIDLCFNAPRYQCIFQENVDDVHKVSLWNNGISVADMLVEKSLANAEQVSAVTLKDEAIDLTIIIGQQILCRVTHVESWDKFYIQLDLEKAAVVEETMAKFDVSLLTPLAEDSLYEQDDCIVKHQEKLYRAKLVDVSDPTKISAVLPDYGNTITVSVDNVMILPTELSIYYYQCLECSFNNLTTESNKLMTLDQLKETLTGNKFIVYVNDVDGIRVVATLYDAKSGKKVAVFEPDEGAYDEVVQLCTRAVYNYNFGMAYLAHVENLNDIYLQKSTDIDRIEIMLSDLYTFYEEGTPEAVGDLYPEALCAAKSSDGNWYRATAVSVGESDCKVQFSDYGNTETIALDNIKKLDPKFYEPCALALVASLGLIALQEDAIAKLKEWIADKEVQVTLAFGTDGWLASLHLDGVDLSMKLVNEQLATPKVAADEETKSDAVAEEPANSPSGCTKVYVSHIDSPGQFYLQMADKIDQIEEIQAELQANSETYPDIENREVGTLCVAKYSADDLWYRAEILDLDPDITTVRFIDYGNADVLDNKPGLLKVIPDGLKAIDRLAVKSSVNAIPTGTGQWSEPASDHFTKLVGDISLPVDALIVLKDICTYVDLFVNGQNITDKLVSEGHATRSEEPECGDWPSCFASHVNSPAEFWIQLESATADLQAMETAMVDAENFPELESKEEGVLCAAKYPEDGAWYRAQVIVDGSEGTEVLFMDYGNASIVTELRSLPEELKAKPALSRKCALQKPRDIKNWSRKSEMKFNDIAAEGATVFNVQFIAAGDISIVELYLEGKSVTEELVELCEPQTERPPPLGQDQRNTGKLSYVNKLDEFYIHFDDKSSELDNVVKRMYEAEEFQTATELKVGSLCAAFWADDEQWYRGKILEFCDIGAHVQFIDYGNKAKCENFKQLPEDLIAVEPLAKCCSLAGLTELEMSNETIKKNLEKILDQGSTFEVELLDTSKGPMLVRLLLNDKEIRFIETPTEIESEPKAMNEPSEIISEMETKDHLNAEDLDLNESLDSAKTVVENIPPSEKPQSSSQEPCDYATLRPQSPNKILKRPDQDEYKESQATDAGCINEQEKTQVTECNIENDDVSENSKNAIDDVSSPVSPLKNVNIVVENTSLLEEPQSQELGNHITQTESSENIETSNSTLETSDKEEPEESIPAGTDCTNDQENAPVTESGNDDAVVSDNTKNPIDNNDTAEFPITKSTLENANTVKEYPAFEEPETQSQELCSDVTTTESSENLETSTETLETPDQEESKELFDSYAVCTDEQESPVIESKNVDTIVSENIENVIDDADTQISGVKNGSTTPENEEPQNSSQELFNYTTTTESSDNLHTSNETSDIADQEESKESKTTDTGCAIEQENTLVTETKNEDCIREDCKSAIHNTDTEKSDVKNGNTASEITQSSDDPQSPSSTETLENSETSNERLELPDQEESNIDNNCNYDQEKIPVVESKNKDAGISENTKNAIDDSNSSESHVRKSGVENAVDIVENIPPSEEAQSHSREMCNYITTTESSENLESTKETLEIPNPEESKESIDPDGSDKVKLVSK